MTVAPLSLRDVHEAALRLRGHAHRTPIMTCGTLDAAAGGRRILLKCENFQKVGAFKFRGACNAVLGLSDEKAALGVVTHSSGNHAQALALAARTRGIAAHIVMPSNAPAVKRRAVEGYGAAVYECEPSLAARENETRRVIAQTGATLVHPYDDRAIIAGQGTVALELLTDEPDLDVIVAPVGGGGLLSGTCVTAHGIRSDLRVIAAEPTGADDAARSLAAGRLIPQTGPETIADGLLTSLGDLTWPIIRDHVERVVTVTDDAIRAAMRLVWERAKIIIEPSAAVAVAAVLSDEMRGLDGIESVGVIISGGNVDLDSFAWT